MSNSNHQSNSSHPLRQKHHKTCTFDPVTGQMRPISERIESDCLDAHGAINTNGVDLIHFRDCGCSAESGGRCHYCGDVSCVKCHGQCHYCHVPICLPHSYFDSDEEGTRIRMCGVCHDVHQRKQIHQKVISFLLGPFSSKTK